MKLQKINQRLTEHHLEITKGAKDTWVLWDVSEEEPVLLGSYDSPDAAYIRANRVILGIPSLGYPV